MPDVIHLLPDSIANQIAAGEVVQRPASAVKELMENAIDAGATHITLLIRDAGKALLQVIDNGVGMSETDARMSLERHATSKIKTADDLFSLHTMGFRGEALASMAAISQMEMKTRTAQQEMGCALYIEGSEVKNQEPVACEQGTSIAVKNLFFNVPARRQFLKSNAREYEYIVDEFVRLALSCPAVSFKLVNEKDTEYDVVPSKLSQRIVNLLGKQYQDQLLPCQEETSWVKLTGYVGRPESARKSRGGQYIFVNHRYIKNPTLNYAILQAYEGMIPEKSYPFYVLFLEINPQKIDVNVHPTKTEIKFDDERAVYGVVLSAARQALGTHNMAPSLDFSSDVNIMEKIATSPSKDDYFNERYTYRKENTANWKTLFESEKKSTPISTAIRYESKLNTGHEAIPSLRPTFQWQNKYIVTGLKDNILIINQQLASERIMFEKYMRYFQTGGASQQLLFPLTVHLSPTDFLLVMDLQKELTSLGFRMEEFGKNTLLVSGIPIDLSGNEKELVEGLIEQFKRNQSEMHLPLRDNLARALAKRFAVKEGHVLKEVEMESLIGGLFSCQASTFSPDGHPIFFVIDNQQLKNYFIK